MIIRNIDLLDVPQEAIDLLAVYQEAAVSLF